MRSLLVIIDGLGDDPVPEWKGLTPFDHAEHKNMVQLISLGTCSNVSICERISYPRA